MAEDIKLYGCDPEYLQTVWDLMIEECGVMTEVYVGFMAETCESGQVLTPECHDPRTVAIKDAPIIYYTHTGLPEPVEVIVQHTNPSNYLDNARVYDPGSDNFIFYDTDHNIRYGPYDTIRPYPHSLGEGAKMIVTLYKAGTEEVLATSDITFGFERNKFDWPYARQILINYTEDSIHTINFADWGLND